MRKRWRFAEENEEALQKPLRLKEIK